MLENSVECQEAVVSTTADNCHPMFRSVPSGTGFKKLRKRLIRQVREALDDFGMVTPGDKWLVCLSGGKDSYALLALLLDLQWRGMLPVELLAMNLDQKQPGFPTEVLPDWFEENNIPYHIEVRDTYSVVMDKIPAGKTYCSLCSRLRRGNLYRVAKEKNCSSVVLGHHRDDALETFFLNLFFGGRMAAMAPKLKNENGDRLLLRPLIYCSEDDLDKFAQAMKFPIIPCDLCGSQDGLQRQQMKRMLDQWEIETPGRKQIIFRALTNVRPAHLLDSALFDFDGLKLDDIRAHSDGEAETECGAAKAINDRMFVTPLL